MQASGRPCVKDQPCLIPVNIRPHHARIGLIYFDDQELSFFFFWEELGKTLKCASTTTRYSPLKIGCCLHESHTCYGLPDHMYRLHNSELQKKWNVSNAFLSLSKLILSGKITDFTPILGRVLHLIASSFHALHTPIFGLVATSYWFYDWLIKYLMHDSI